MYFELTMQSRNWGVNTWNNPPQNAETTLRSIKTSYTACATEIGAGGTRHLQFYMEFPGVMRFKTLQKRLPSVHLETRRGTAKQASNYCTGKNSDGTPKAGVLSFWETGKLSDQGHRSDLDAVRQQALDDGLRGVTRTRNAQQIRLAQLFLTYNEEPRTWKPHVVWIYGDSGSGKTRMAYASAGNDVYVKKNGSRWWDGYDGQTTVILDDFRDTWFDGEITEMLSILDRYECRVEYKGGSRQLRATHMYITSIRHPDTMYRNTTEPIEQLMRRIDLVTHCKSSEITALITSFM